MSAVIEAIRRAAEVAPAASRLPEAQDPRVVRAAELLARDRLAEVTLLGPREELRTASRAAGVTLDGVTQDTAPPRRRDRAHARRLIASAWRPSSRPPTSSD